MNILSIFKERVINRLSQSDQAVSEKLIELATFFYKVDQRVSLEEQRYMEELLETLDWNSSISPEAYQQDCLARIHRILSCDEESICRYLSDLMERIAELDAADTAADIAKAIADADGEIADQEIRYLDLVKSYRSA